MKFFDIFTALSIFLLSVSAIFAQDCPDFAQNNLVRNTENCQSGIFECLPIEYEYVDFYEYSLNGNPFSGTFMGCGTETTVSYDVLGIGNYPVHIDGWEVDGIFFSGLDANSPAELASVMSSLTNSNWSFDDMTFKIESTNAPDSLGWLTLSEINTGLIAQTLPEYSTISTQTAFEFPIGNHVFVAYNFLEDCADTLLIDVVCQQITDTLVFNIEIGQVDSLVLATTNLGMINYFANECQNQSGNFVGFQVFPSTTALQFTGLAEGTEQACIVICDVNGICDTTYVFVNVSNPPPCVDPVIDFVQVVDKNCDEPGSIEIFMEDQSQDFQFNWDNNQPNTNHVFNLDEGIFNVTITYVDSTLQSCFTTGSYPVNFDDTLEDYEVTIFPDCDNNGFVTFNNIGLTYTWEDGFQGGDRFDLMPGVYNITVSTNNCEEVTTVVMPEISINLQGSVANVCDSLGSIYLDVSGGVPPFSYQWSDGVLTGNRIGVDIGTYFVTVTDANNCTAENTFEVIDDCPSTSCTTPVITNVTINDPSCSSSGLIVIELLDNSIDYIFDWTHGGPNSGIQTNLEAGDYIVTISNIDPVSGEICSITADFVLSDVDSLNFFLLNSENATCVDPGLAEYSDPNLNYLWSDGGTGHFRDDLLAGNYIITVSTPNGNCSQVESLTIEEEESIFISGFAANVCDTLGSIYINVTGNFFPFTYEWSNGSTMEDQPVLDVGIYSLTITDSEGCTAVESYEIVDDCLGVGCDDPVITDVTIINPDCLQLGMIDVQVENLTPNLSFQWSDGSDLLHQIIDLEAGTYSLTLTDFDPQTGATCSTVETFVLTSQDSLEFFLVNSTSADCGNPGSAEYSDPTLNYIWSDGGFGHLRNDLAAGFYNITVTAPGGFCEEVAFLNIQDVSSINITGNAANVCDTLGSIYLSVTGNNPPFSYNWSNSSTMLSQPELDVGVYSLTVTDDQGCTAVETYTIIDDCTGTSCVDPVIASVLTVNPDCTETGGIEIQVENMTPNLTYLWSNGSTSSQQFDLLEGTYSVTISDFDPQTGETCSITETFVLTSQDSLGFFLISSMDAGCGNLGTAEYSDSGLLYNWSDGGFGFFRDDLSPGVYTITVTNDDETCLEIATLEILDIGGIALEAFPIVSNVCDTLGSIYLTIFGGTEPYSYDWDDLPGSMDPEDREAIDVGTYTVTITDAVGCQTISSFTIVDDCPMTGDLIFTFVPADEDILCGESAPVVSAIAESDCPGDITYDFAETVTSGACPNNLTITRTWTATDDCGNTASAQQFIFVVDIEAPEIVTVGDLFIDLLNGDSLPDPYGLAFAEDDCGDIADFSFNKEENITTDGYQVVYNWIAVDECGNVSTALQTLDITGGMIWPGDTDSNKVVNNLDVFNIGFAYGSTGPTRINPTLDFLPQYAAPWSENGIDEVNFRHADTDGNGIVDQDDILAVNLNYDLVHNLQEAGDTRESFDIDFVYETITADNWVHVAILLGNTDEPIDDFYGAGFIIEYDQTMVVENTAHVDFSESWTGTFFTDFIALQKDFHDEGRLDVGLVRIDQEGIDGSGKIGSFRFQLPEGVEFTPFTLTAREGSGVRADKSPYELETAEVIITNTKDILPSSTIDVYPNPTETELFLAIPTDLEVTNIQLFGTNGQLINEYDDPTIRSLEVNNLPTGLYYLQVLTTEGTWSDKVSIVK